MGFYAGKPVLVTGADGFIGSHLVEALVAEGASVRAFAYYNSLGQWGWLEDLAPEVQAAVEVFPGDIRDPRRVAEAVRGRAIVFHLASLIAIPYSYHAPDSYVQTNIGGALNLLNACRDHGVERLLHTSTSEVYGTALRVPIDESHPLQGQSPYSASKIGADMLAESYHRAFGVPVAIVRPFNTYGPRQSARAVIPTILAQLLAGAEEIRLGALSPTRDFNYVADTARGFVLLGQCPRAVGGVTNLASGREVSIGELARLCMAVTGRQARIVCEAERLRPADSEVERLLGDAGRARELTGFAPAHTLEEGLALTAQWVGRNLDRFRPREYAI